MDDLVRSMLLILLAGVSVAVVIFSGIVLLVLSELKAIATGDTGFIAASIVAILLLCVAYVGAGFWLRRKGRI
jgi:hypothetical protein